MNVHDHLVASVSSALGDHTAACAESVTSGRIAALLASAERATTFFCGGLVAYQPAVKANLLGVSAHRIVSADTAVQMAVGAADLFGADVTVATTGLAAAAEDEGEPGGTVYVATLVDGRVNARRHRFTGPPPTVCDRAAARALTDLVRHLTAPTPMGMSVDVALAVLDAGGELSGFDESEPLVEGPNSA